jgi:hypothetical protein
MAQSLFRSEQRIPIISVLEAARNASPLIVGSLHAAIGDDDRQGMELKYSTRRSERCLNSTNFIS